jgi:fatty acid desaturase
MAEASSANAIRTRMRRELPADTFARRPLRALRILPALAMIVVGTLAIVRLDLAWYLALPLSLVIGNAYAVMGFVAHEALHGALVQGKGLQNLIGHMGLGPFLISPNLWRTWHNQIHHGQTNRGNRDPDGFGTLERYERVPSTRFVTRLAPGSGRWISGLFLFYWFTFHGQVVLWIQTRFLRGFAGLDARRARFDSFLYLALWIALAAWAGPRGTLFAIVLPMAVANFTVMSYIATNHFLRPQTEIDDPLESAMSVTTLPWVDRLHLNFSHHVEHHLFPTMPAKHAPRLRTWLRVNFGDRYVSPAHWRAVVALYRTPRVYRDAKTLVDPDHPSVSMDVDGITRALQAGGLPG